mmetsp:Transcript_32099/g.44501  ORF Transcript_32099/g.44501 Transcript_32099/m.44501 type:complete len:216 (-) Transcript_32099:198-845(-)|eukprot:CAMPEP_0196579544 /NCGR_PEP_ID=MMETSP1081-20130531/22558_1 /TAXON_ID=36882 /ORGANISM="Pyramimonas amylifera, Strain CCMP720" /LENGTH=215 /DNA_ID=CAMNT_0041899167 /DNA_START=117 /DNA_END=764 /DNA_ORIENTATION=+
MSVIAKSSASSIVLKNSTSFRVKQCAAKPVVTCSSNQEQKSVNLSRREILTFVSVAGPVIVSSPARALIDFDEDDELLSKVKADRASKIQQERISERNFVKENGFTDKKLDKEIAVVQKAINRLSKTGQLIEAKDSNGLVDVVMGDWVNDLKVATDALSLTNDAKSATEPIFTGLSALQSDVKSKKSSKKSYLTTVNALENWATVSGVSSTVSGL